MRPPPTRRDDTVDNLHGIEVKDPYRWLEDPNHPEVQAWVEQQNRVTFDFLERIAGRPRILARITELWDYERLGIPFLEGGRLFFSKNDGLQNQAVLYTAPSLDAEPKVLLDPNRLSPDGTVALSSMAVSRDGRRLAYGLSASGSDWMEWKVRDVESGHDLDDHVRWVRFSGAAWTHDGTGFFYSRYDEPPPGEAYTALARDQKLCYHRLGTPQSEDELVYQRPDQPEWGFGASVTDDGRYLVISVWHGTSPKNRLFYRDLEAHGPIVELLADGDAAYHIVGNDGSRFFVHTDLDAPRGRLIEIDLAHPERSAWREIIPETEHTLTGITWIGGRFFANYLAHACSRVHVHGRDGEPAGEVELPGVGTVVGFGGRPEDRFTFYAYTGFTTPARIYRYDIAEKVSTLHFAPELKFDPDAYQTKQVFFESKDGTRVPMFLSGRADLPLDAGDRPTYLYGYGGFNIPLTPAFDPSRLAWMEMGGVLAVANLRGGGEYGEEWHQAGCGHRRQNVFDDFIGAAEHLLATRVTRPDRIAIAGSSNGGLLVGAVMTQRPELFGAALPDVGVLDMLRFHKFTIGWAWVSDYGSPDDPDDFQVLLRYSPLHNLRPAAYPATLITTADTDDRVVSAHSYKFAAALQAAQRGSAPVLLRVDVKAGHGAGKPTAKVIAMAADRLAFLEEILKMRVA